jgi:hypothetical protein
MPQSQVSGRAAVSAGRSRRRHDYDAVQRRITEALQRRMAGFEGLLHRAADGDRGPLIEYCENGPRQRLAEQDWMALAWFFNKVLSQPSRDGRPRGSLKPRNAARKFAKHLLQVAARAWCVEHGRQRASNRVLRESWAGHAIELAKREFPQAGDISYDDLEDDHSDLSPGQRVEDFVCYEVLFEAEWEMKHLALE